MKTIAIRKADGFTFLVREGGVIEVITSVEGKPVMRLKVENVTACKHVLALAEEFFLQPDNGEKNETDSEGDKEKPDDVGKSTVPTKEDGDELPPDDVEKKEPEKKSTRKKK